MNVVYSTFTTTKRLNFIIYKQIYSVLMNYRIGIQNSARNLIWNRILNNFFIHYSHIKYAQDLLLYLIGVMFEETSP